MWWLVGLGGCQDVVLEQVQAWTNISREVTVRPELVEVQPETPVEAEAPAAPTEYNPISVPQGARDNAFSMPGVGKRPGATGEMVLPR